jgi:hypothetical protein
MANMPPTPWQTDVLVLDITAGRRRASGALLFVSLEVLSSHGPWLLI